MPGATWIFICLRTCPLEHKGELGETVTPAELLEFSFNNLNIVPRKFIQLPKFLENGITILKFLHMKKLLTISFCLSMVLFFSFRFQQNRIKMLGDQLYQITPASAKAISDKDKEAIKNIVARHYNLKDFTEEIVITKDDDKNRKTTMLVDRSICNDVVTTKAIIWFSKAEVPPAAEELNAILSKYARK